MRNNSPTEILPSERVYALTDLSKVVQENLLRLQNTDGDFLKVSSGITERRVALLILAAIISFGLAAIIADSSLDLKRIIVFSADALLLLIWFVYLIAGIYRAYQTPLKNRIYLTPAQVIETLDGTVRFRELKDAAEISVNKFSTGIGRRNKLDILFGDGDLYQFYIPGMTNSKQIDLMQSWREKAVNWRREAISAAKRGDHHYLESQNIFSKLSESNTPVLQRKLRAAKENLLLVITMILFALNGAFIFFSTK